ncbi:MAG: RHS repeat-associated core domain-containing protein [Phycisphaerae bacterium]
MAHLVRYTLFGMLVTKLFASETHWYWRSFKKALRRPRHHDQCRGRRRHDPGEVDASLCVRARAALQRREPRGGVGLISKYACVNAAGGIGGLLAVLDWTLVTPQMSGLGQAYLYDGNGNVGQLISLDDGSVVTAYEYDAYGNITAETDGEYAPENPFRFSTKFHDDETGWVYYGYRFYGPKWGRWGSRDPLRELTAYNYYVAFAMTLGLVDYLGLQPIPIQPGQPGTTGLPPVCPVDDYWNAWKREHPGFSQAQYSSMRRTLNRGCIGITCLNLGISGNPDLSNCFANKQDAFALRNKWIRDCTCTGTNQDRRPNTPQIFGFRFWNNYRALETDANRRVRMPRTCTEGRGNGYINFDFAFYCGQNRWIHANNCHYCQGMGAMEVYRDDWPGGYQGFDQEVYCVSCEECAFGLAGPANRPR